MVTRAEAAEEALALAERRRAANREYHIQRGNLVRSPTPEELLRISEQRQKLGLPAIDLGYE